MVSANINMMSFTMILLISISLQGIFGQIEIRSGKKHVKQFVGEDFEYRWFIKGLKLRNVMILYKGDTRSESSIATYIILDNSQLTRNSEIVLQKPFLNDKRLTLEYTYLGSESALKFSIKNLNVTDGDAYILDVENIVENFTLEVLKPPITIKDLNPVYVVNSTNELTVSIQVSWVSMLAVTWFFLGKYYDGTSDKTNNTMNNNIYTYMFTLPNTLKPCEKEKLSYVVTALSKNFTGEANVTGVCGPKPGDKISDGICAGIIIGFEAGFIVLVLVVLLYLLKWRPIEDNAKTIIVIVLAAFGVAVMITFAAVYGGMRKDKTNDTCDKGFIAVGVVDVVVLVVAIAVGVRGTGGRNSKVNTPDNPDESTKLKNPTGKDGSAKVSPNTSGEDPKSLDVKT